MSRIGKKPVTINQGVKVAKKDNILEVTGPKGTLTMEVNDDIKVEINEGEVVFTRDNDLKKTRALHGLYRALFQNLITGCTEGFTKRLDLVGIGYKAELKGDKLVLQLGYSHPIVFVAPKEIKLEVPAPTNIIISGIDKQLVGSVAAKIRSFREPEPYKGKGIKYDTEIIRRKAGKTAAK
ncbi:MAG TPA: 50S ribosomal protein L6 [Ignavibacteria bacterium]|nr:50S ribosomal protein L6 [Ignavibacteria bacterium]